jgi:hypothetical protein
MSSIYCARPAPAPYLTGTAWGRSGGLGGTNPHQVAAEDELVEGSVVSNGGGSSVVFIVLVVKLRRLTNGGGRRCGVERTLLCNHFIL